MNYFNEGLTLFLNDFVEFCRQHPEDFNTEQMSSLIEMFLQTLQISSPQTVEASKKQKPTSSVKTASVRVSSKTPAVASSSTSITKVGAKTGEISLDDFSRLNIEDMQQSTWGARYTVIVLKKLCSALGLQCGKQTKAQLIDGLITYKQTQQGENVIANANATDDQSPEEEPQPIVVAQKPKRRLQAAPIQQRTVEIIKKHGLNLVLCDDDKDVVLVLSDEKQLIGYISKESYDDDDNGPTLLNPTKQVIFLAKSLGINYDSSEFF